VLQKEQLGRVLRLTLDRPEKRNALNIELSRAIVETVRDADRDPSIGAIMIGANGKSFCAGMDLDEVARGATEETNMLHEQLFTLGARTTTPLIAAVHGAALGGGTGFVANCHVVVADPDATFGLTEIRLGLWPFLVFRAVAMALGERRTVELALTGRIFGSAEAREIALAHEVAADAASRALEIAQTIAGYSPTAIHNGLSFVEEARGMGWVEAGKVARRVRDWVFTSPDFREGLRAFREKRPAQWPSLSHQGNGPQDIVGS
jgi:enoyl-CoA hydratase/carnithine racemase